MTSPVDERELAILEALAAYIPMDRRQAMARGEQLPSRMTGAALFADISGFTPLTDSLVRMLGPQRGAEELLHYLNAVYDALIAELYRYRGSVVGFSGDALTCWLDGDSGARAVACGLAMQSVMAGFSEVRTPDGGNVSLGLKAAVAAGTVHRFVVGDPRILLIDAMAGSVLDSLATAEHLAHRGEVVVSAGTAERLLEHFSELEWRTDADSGERIAVITGLGMPVATTPWPPVPIDKLHEADVRPWVLPPVYQRLRSGGHQFLAELRPAVALFVRFGGLDFDRDPEVAGKLDAYVRWVQEVLARFDGSLIQVTIGDKGSYLYAVFGAPHAHEDDAARAVSAAIELASPPEHLAYVGAGQIGISRGRMRTGPCGAVGAQTYAAIGAETNMAARLMQAAQPGQILVSAGAQEAAVSAAAWEALPPLGVKGRAEPVTVYAATRLLAQKALRLHEPRYTLPMIGREAELATIADRLALAQTGSGQVVGIVAEPGVGKSRLVAEALRLAGERNLSCYAGECPAHGATASYDVWRRIWRGIFELDDAAATDRQIAGLEACLTQIDASLLQRLPLLGPVLNIPIPDTDLTRSLEAKLRKSSLESLLVDCLRARARRGPIVLVLEDCHWIDSLSLDLLEVLARAGTALPVLLLLSCRPPDVHRPDELRLQSLPSLNEIRLHDFTAHEAGELIRLKLAQFYGSQADLPPTLVERITARADGNPFYIEELLNYFRDRGLGPADLATLEQLDLPTSLHSLILSRIDRLGEHEKLVLKVASVIGRRFPASWVWGSFAQLGEPAQVRSSLDALSAHDLLPLDQPEPDLAYIFKHAVTQEVSYECMPFATRTRLHAQVGEFIERAFSGQLDQYVALLAHHYDLSDVVDKKREYLRKAGDAAQATYANAAAIDYYRRLAGLLPPAEQIAVLLRLGQVLDLVGEWGEAAGQYRLALQLAEQTNDLGAQASCRHAIGWLLRKQGEYREAMQWLGQAKAGLESLGDLAAVSQVMTDSGEVSRHLGAFVEAKQWYEDALRLADAVQDEERRLQARAQALKGAGTLAAQQGDNPTARARYEESLAIRRALGDKPGAATLLHNLGIIAYYMDDFAAARELDEQALAAFRQIGDRFAASQSLNNLAGVVAASGDYAMARHLLLESVDIQRQLGGEGGLAIALNSLADVVLDEGDGQAARPLLVESLTINAKMGDSAAIAYLLDDFAALAAAESRPERAMRLAGAAAAARSAIGSQVPEGERLRFDRLQAPAHEMLGEEAAAAFVAEGRAMSLEQAVQYALHEG